MYKLTQKQKESLRVMGEWLQECKALDETGDQSIQWTDWDLMIAHVYVILHSEEYNEEEKEWLNSLRNHYIRIKKWEGERNKNLMIYPKHSVKFDDQDWASMMVHVTPK